MADKDLKLKDKLPAITVYCGASEGSKSEYIAVATELGEILAEEGIRLVYGGGDKGMMGAVSNTVHSNGGKVTGVIPDFMIELEWANTDLEDLRIVYSMPERKHMLLELGDGLITAPGGIGTMEEFFEALSWSQLRIHMKPIGILNTDGYYDPLLELLDKLIENEFVDPRTSELIVVDDDPRRLLEKMAEWEHHGAQKEIV